MALHDGPQSARTRLPFERLARDRAQRRVIEFEVHILHVEEFLILPHQRVLRLGQNAHQRILIELAERRDHRQTADEFRNQPELQEVLGLHVVEQF